MCAQEIPAFIISREFFLAQSKEFGAKGTGEKIASGKLMKQVLQYLANLSTGRLILWCYLIWYLVVLARYFDPNPRLWLTSVGLSVIIGIALYISSTTRGNKLERWQIIRLFLMPLFVSSFAALVKGKSFVLIFSPDPQENFLALILCGMFCGLVFVLKRMKKG